MAEAPRWLQLEDGVVDLETGELRREGAAPDRLTGKRLEVLRYLAARPGVEVREQEFHSEVWENQGRARASSQALKTVISRLREAIEVDRRVHRLVVTTSHGGYRFVPPVSVSGSVSIGSATVSVAPSGVAEPGGDYHPGWYAAWPEAEARARRYLDQPGNPLVVVAPAQGGKSWFVSHLLHTALAAADVVVRAPYAADPDQVLLDVGFACAAALGIDTSDGSDAQLVLTTGGSPEQRLTRLLEEHALPAVSARLVLVFDGLHDWVEAGGLLRWLRSLPPQRREPWPRLRIVATASTDPVVLTDTPQVSSTHFPQLLEFHDLQPANIAALATRVGVDLPEADLATLTAELGGQPYLVHAALVARLHGQPGGRLDEHERWLRRQLRLLASAPAERAAVQAVLAGHEPGDLLLCHRLERAGLLRYADGRWQIRNGLLATFLTRHLPSGER